MTQLADSATPDPLSCRRFPLGAEAMEGATHFRVWAPRSTSAALVLGDIKTGPDSPMQSEGNGYFSLLKSDCGPGDSYWFRLDCGTYPDPTSRFQPEGPHGPSQVVDPAAFAWTDESWPGVSRQGQIIYEMHIGTFTPEGTWDAAIEKLDGLASLGITLLEVMPVSDFAGDRGWGYDGVNLFAPTRLYGQPDDFRRFVDRAHALGMGVILDVVYNHFGPDGNYLARFSKDYLHYERKNEWGDSINFDGENCGPVREFFLMNAAYWIAEYHLDGLRLDATQQIHDASDEHMIKAIGVAVREAAPGRQTYVVAENDQQDPRIARPIEEGGYGLDALWNDDFHHSAMVALTGRNEGYYTDFKGQPQEFVSLSKRGYLFQGQGYKLRGGPRGSSALDLHPENFVICLQNHDQVANSLWGRRAHQLSHGGTLRALTALLLLNPSTPMLFQGQEFAASAPFLFFAHHHPELARLVSEGRAGELGIFPSIASDEARLHLPDPEKEETFLRCKLDWAERERHSDVYRLHRDLIALRKTTPHFGEAQRGDHDGAVLDGRAFLLRFFGENDDRLLVINLGLDLIMDSVAEPLMAPLSERDWQLIWSSENPSYGGGGTPPLRKGTGWVFPGQSAVLLASAT